MGRFVICIFGVICFFSKTSSFARSISISQYMLTNPDFITKRED